MFEKRIFVLLYVTGICVWKKNFCPRIFVYVCVSQILVQEFCVWKRTLSYNQNFVFGKKNFCLRICVCVCVCVSEFWSKNFVFGKELLSYNRNFVFEKEFLVLLYVTGILCLEKEFLSQNFVCVCLRIFVSRILCFFGKRIFGLIVCNRNFVFGKRIFVTEF